MGAAPAGYPAVVELHFDGADAWAYSIFGNHTLPYVDGVGYQGDVWGGLSNTGSWTLRQRTDGYWEVSADGWGETSNKFAWNGGGGFVATLPFLACEVRYAGQSTGDRSLGEWALFAVGFFVYYLSVRPVFRVLFVREC